MMSGTRFRPAAWLVTLLLIPSACITDPDPMQREPLQCADPQSDMTGWVSATTVTFDYKLPPYFTWVPDAEQWEFGQSWIKIHVLSPGQFPDTPAVTLTNYSECHATISIAENVLIQLGLTGVDAPWGTGWYTSASFETVPIDSEGLAGLVLIEAFTKEQIEIQSLVQMFFTVSFKPLT